jgi:precorrin-8X/cobalt-precorrin-8 methylmutase
LLHDLLDVHQRRRTLIGVDFSLGYPAGTANALGLSGDPWSAVWELLEHRIVDGDRNENNRFEVAAWMNGRMSGAAGPFWGCPRATAQRTLTTTKPTSEGGPEQWRVVEEALRSDGKRPFSSWQLLGAGCVGSQSLLGIPLICRLARRYQGRFDVWPFTTGLETPVVKAGSVVVAEIWPSLISSQASSDRIRDQKQVEDVAVWLADLDRAGTIDSLFTPSVSSDTIAKVTREEGWVLGVGADRRTVGPLAGSVDGPSTV